MISVNMKLYNYYTLGDSNGYGQAAVPDQNATPKGKIKISIHSISQTVADNVRYKDASYMGLTHSEIDDTYIIQYGEERLKVLHVNPVGRYKQVFLGAIL